MPSFNRSGLASLDDFDAPEYSALFNECERAQDAFLARREAFFGDEYPWERDALHQWSRCWEYPYHLLHLRANLDLSAGPIVGDFGCGITFFPFHVAALGARVVAVDHDPAVIRDAGRAASTFGLDARVDPRKNEGVSIPAADGELDALYSVSVVEHIPDPQRVVDEIARVLKPGGLFVVTLDVDLKGGAQLNPEQFEAFRALCSSHFELHAAETTIHPSRMLTCYNGPYARSHQSQVPGVMLRERSGRLRPLIGGPIASDLVDLACYGAVFKRRVK